MSNFRGIHWSKMPNREEILERIRISKTGKKMSPEICKKRSETAKKYGFGKWMKGKKLSKETRLKQSLALRGSNAPSWKGGITPENIKIRHSIENKLWREAVFLRDNWICQKCNKKGGKLRAHHIKLFSEFPDLRFSVANGLTLCHECHLEEHKRLKNLIQ